MATPTRSPSMPHSAALTVLTNAPLLKTIIGFQTGIPEELWVFIRQRLPCQGGYKDPIALASALAEHGSFRLVELALSVVWYGMRWDPLPKPCPRPVRVNFDHMGDQAIRHNRPEMVQWLLETGRNWFNSFGTNLSLAIFHYVPGDTRVLDLLATHEMLGCRRGTLEPESEGKHDRIYVFPDLTLLRWLQEHVPEIEVSTGAMDEAARRGDLDIVRYLHEHRPEVCTSVPYEEAWDNRHREVWWFLVENRPAPPSHIIGRAILTAPGPRFFRRLKRANIEVDPVNITNAVYMGNSRLVGLLCGELGIPVPRKALIIAAEHGHIGVFRSLRKRHALKDEDALKAALDVATSRGHHKLVQFFHFKSLGGFTPKTMDIAAERGDLAMVKFLHSNRAEGCTVAAMDGAADKGLFEIVRFLHENRTEGCTVKAMDRAAANGHLQVVEFLHQHRTEGCTTAAMDDAAMYNHLDVVRFLHENRTEGCTVNALDYAGSVEMLQYLLENQTKCCTVAVISTVKSYALDSSCVNAMVLLFRRFPSLFTTEMLPDLLKVGCFDIWMALRSQYGCDNTNDGAKEAIEVAVRSYRFCTIQFLLCDQQRSDLVVSAFVHASSTNREWLTVLVKLVGEAVPIADIIEQIVIRNKSDVNKELETLIGALSVTAEDHERNVAHAIAVSRVNQSSSFRADDLARVKHRSPEEITETEHPLAFEADLPSWLYHELYAPCSSLCRQQQDENMRDHFGHPTWIKSAIIHEDLAFVRRLRQLGQEATYRDDPRFSFEGARKVAAFLGQLETLQWLIAEVPEVPVEAGLLDVARAGERTQIAEWLVANCPAGCVGRSAPSEWWDYYLCPCWQCQRTRTAPHSGF